MNTISLYMHHVGMFVSDLDTSISWWKRMFGFSLVKKGNNRLPGQGIVSIAWIENPNHSCYLELFQYDGLKPFTMENYFGTLGTKHIGLYVRHEDFLNLKAHLKAEGANIVVDTRWPNDQFGDLIEPLPATADPKESSGVIFITDPDGIWIEIMEEYYPGIGPTRSKILL
ncbi:MAG: VOC family protein [Spirochaetia bacterium]|nr:VOC family protein [Spirochaetia bacterium]